MQTRWGAVLAALVALGAPGRAADAPRQIVVHMDVVSLGAEAATELKAGGREPLSKWQAALSGGDAHVVQTLDFLALSGQQAVMLVGHKDPIVYYDPKAQQFQIQFVDTGLKLLTRVSTMSPDTVAMEVSADFSLLQLRRPYGNPPDPMTYPQTSCLQNNSRVDNLHYDEAVVIARAHGPQVKMFWGLLGPAASLPPDNDLVITVSVEKGQ